MKNVPPLHTLTLSQAGEYGLENHVYNAVASALLDGLQVPLHVLQEHQLKLLNSPNSLVQRRAKEQLSGHQP
jgi:hypothetical protein